MLVIEEKNTDSLPYRGKELRVLMQCTIRLVDAIVLEEIVCLFSFFHRRITVSVIMFRMDGKEDESLKILIGWNTRIRWDKRMKPCIVQIG